MPKFRVPCPPAFRRQMVELVRSGRTPEELSREFELTAQSIWNGVRQAEGTAMARKRMARLMRGAGLRGVSRRRFPTTTQREPGHSPANALVGRDFRAAGPNRLWVADITDVPTAAGFLFLAVVLDVWSRRIVGWTMATDLRTRWVLNALDMAVTARKPADVMHHSDQGSQSTSAAFGCGCKEAGARPSTGSVGDAYDNAMAEAFLATLEGELLDRRSFRSQAEARMAVFAFIEGFYNPARRHSALGYLSPIEYGARAMAENDGPLPANRPRKRGNFNSSFA